MATDRRTRIWLTPATVVIAVAVLTTMAAVSWLVGEHIRGEFFAAPTAAPTAGAATYTVPGKVQLPAGQWIADGAACRSTTVSPDAQVVVTDAHDASLAYAPLQAGRVTAARCELPFTLTVPAGHGTYGVDVPTVGRLDYTEDQMRDLVELNIG